VPSLVAAGAVGLLVLALVAFWPLYLSRPFASIDAYTHVHAAIGVLWLGLLITQPLLLLASRSATHRALGRVSYVLAPLFVVSSLLLAHYRFSRMDAATFEREGYTLYLPLSAALLFACAFGLALVHHRPTRLHARFMACTALLLVDPVVGRVLAFRVVELQVPSHYQFITFGMESALILALLATLPPSAKDRRLFGSFAAGYIAVLGLWFVLPHAPAWQGFAQWFRTLPLT
jgi:hypothetical protein